jgi:hypothetical protein
MHGQVFLLRRHVGTPEASIHAFGGYSEGVQALREEFDVLPAGSVAKVELRDEKTFFLEEPFVQGSAKVRFGEVYEQWFRQFFFDVENVPVLGSKSVVTRTREIVLDPCKGAINSVTQAIEQVNDAEEPRLAMRLLMQFVGTGINGSMASVAQAFLSKRSLLSFPFCTRELQDQLRNQFRCFVKAAMNRICALQESADEQTQALLANVETLLVDLLPMLACWEPDLHLLYPPNIRRDIWLWLLVNQRLQLTSRDVRLLICAQIASRDF